MTMTQGLIDLLAPLGIYSFREGSFSLAELQALGAQLDKAKQELARVLRESMVLTAQEEGLSQMEHLLGMGSPAEDLSTRRALLMALLRIGGDSFTLQGIRDSLAACGVACVVEETEKANHVRVRFPDVMGIPDGFARMKGIIEMILPCQLDIFYAFRWCTWGETEDYGLTWEKLGAMSWHDWQVYTE